MIKLDMIALVQSIKPNSKMQNEAGDRVRMTGNGGLILQPKANRWYCFAAKAGGDSLDLLGYLTWGADYINNKGKYIFEAQAKAAEIIAAADEARDKKW